MLSLVLVVGLMSAGLTLVARALAPQLWLLHKPLSCDLCMSWWGAWAGTALLALDRGSMFTAPQTAGLVLGGLVVGIVGVRVAGRLAGE